MYKLDDPLNTMGMATVSIRDVIKLIDSRFRQYEYDGVAAFEWPILILGPVGVGKTQAIVEYAKQRGLGFETLRLANLQETDLIGLPRVREMKDYEIREGYTDDEKAAGNRLIVEWIQQGFFPNPASADFKEKGILFLDEITNCSPNVQAAAWQLMDSARSVGSYHLPDGWFIVAAGNGIYDGGNCQNQGVTNALLGRCEALRIGIDVDCWLSWAEEHNIHPAVTAYIRCKRDEVLWAYDEDSTLPDTRKFPQPRTWAGVSRRLAFTEMENGGETLPTNEVHLISKGLLGDADAVKFAAFYALHENIYPVKDIVSGKIDFKKDGALKAQAPHDASYLQAELVATGLRAKIVEAVKKIQMGSPDLNLNEEIFRLFEYTAILAEDVALDAGITILKLTTLGSTSNATLADNAKAGRPTSASAAWATFYTQYMSILPNKAPLWTRFFEQNRVILDARNL